ncbi:glycoside hydrolase family 95 protein [Niabella hibiscisoli]|uniref:glycoside hydrolase family 95 protein n=1 Tax=Niabella hibiscisoli TaxID=1825928 RepID=UPI001F0F7308|nr:glycoside hydrolase family 95 protein [Niabella hibiscisoli]MCH5718267.1 glycoside hydrolase family 95 protein [Niabella hibiscisoli]
MKYITRTSVFIVAFFIASNNSFAQTNKGLKLWYDRPAAVWEETLPLGNGRLGMMPDGGIAKENIVLNDITLWSGSEQDANNYEANQYLPEIRKMLAAGKNDDAQDLINKHFICKGPGSGGKQWGCFQVLGNLTINYHYNQSNTSTTDYYRSLQLDQALATTSFKTGGVTYTREYITSFGTDVGIIKLTSSKPGALNFSFSLSRPERFNVKVKDQIVGIYGQLDNGTDGKGMQYMALASVKLSGGGSVNTSDKEVSVANATTAYIYVSMGTDFKNPGFESKTRQLLQTAMSKNYLSEKTIHTQNFRKLFNRFSLSLGAGENSSLSTDKRLDLFYKNPQSDNALPVLFLQYGRYLSISSTRVGLLPPNLQGLWANQVNTPWNGDYHLDINVEMNHWHLEAANLSELNLPLAELVKGLVKNGERTAKAYYNANGWIAHVITNVWGFTEPGESASWGIANSGSGWLCENLWAHYAYTKDKKYLKDIYPVLKGSALFYRDALVTDPKTKWLVTAPSVSPENTFVLNGKHVNVCMGPTIDNQITRELFNNVIEASKILNVDAAFRADLTQKLKQIPPAGRIASDGRIMEWLEEYKEADPQHRHISHLWGLYPGSSITANKTPQLMEAAKKTLEVRGDDGPSWAITHKQLFWARLHDGERAFKLLKEVLRPTLKTDINYGAGGGVYPNLLSAGPPFQIDGNFGGSAGILEMLLQSHDGYIELLPSIPEIWKKQGSIKGIKAQNNITIDMQWVNGKVTNYKLYAPVKQQVKLKVNGQIINATTIAR